MKVYHVTTLKKLEKYKKNGYILPPVRAWETLEQAERMSISTGRRIILRLKFKDDAPKLEGHFGKARVSYQPYKFTGY